MCAQLHLPNLCAFAQKGGIVLATMLVALLPSKAMAHADVLGMIAVVDEQIRTNGLSGELLLHRADLYRVHQDWSAALKDYEAAEQFRPGLLPVAHGRALVLAASARLAEARGGFDELVHREPTNVSFLLGRARVLAQLSQPVPAIADYTAALALTKNPGAEDFLERAKLQAVVSGPAVALQGLDEGLARLGWTLTLQRLAVDYAAASGKVDDALARLETIQGRSNRGEQWLVLKAEILRQAGRVTEAGAAYVAALAAINELPPRMAQAAQVTALRRKIELAQAELAAPASGK